MILSGTACVVGFSSPAIVTGPETNAIPIQPVRLVLKINFFIPFCEQVFDQSTRPDRKHRGRFLVENVAELMRRKGNFFQLPCIFPNNQKEL